MKRLPREDRAGLYTTIIIHLVVVIILLASQLGAELTRENTFVLDFTKAEQMEKLQQQLEFEKSVNERLNELLSEGGNQYIRNVTVDRSALRDDRNSAEDAKKLYEDAARLQEELDKGFEAPKEPDEFAAVNTDKPANNTKKEESHYSGPSVLEWSLEGRKASVLKVPAYLGYGAGLVKVIIGVDPQGTVRTVKIDEAASSGDQSLRNYAIRAARTSKFSSSASAPSMQTGYIIYQFIAQ